VPGRLGSGDAASHGLARRVRRAGCSRADHFCWLGLFGKQYAPYLEIDVSPGGQRAQRRINAVREDGDQ